MNRAALAALKSVYDPEVGLDVVTMGLVYGLAQDDATLRVDMTLTSPNCPLGDSIVAMAREALWGVSGERKVDLRLVWEPPWSPRMISAEGVRTLQGGG
ncbi:MAG: metal-sulfur cluster assembly factor [Elusimicrobia bacterium]|nr:metal-sulfur cluster assembly factor [Elusimicrobiota bacterium]